VIFIEAPPGSLAVNATATIDAQTIFSSLPAADENQGVTYSLSCASANACGTLNASDEVGAVVYIAPSAIPSGAIVTVTATSIANTSLSRSAAITIVPPIPITVSFLGTPPASLAVNAQFPLSARIENDVSANPQVTWTVTCGGSACGAFSPATTANEAQTTYTAPAAVPPGGTVTVTAISVTDATKSASANVVITPQAPTLANGTYVFQVAGPVSNGASYLTGVLEAQNGTITGGEQDAIYSADSSSSETQAISGGSYGTTPDGNMEITIVLAPDDTETLTGTLNSSQNGFIGGIDGAIGNGTLELQTSTAAPAGGYAISLDAGSYYDGSPWIDGVIDIDSPGGISGNGSLLDINEESMFYAGSQTIGASTVSAPDAYGRVLFQLNPSGAPLQQLYGPLYVAGYLVDATHLRVIEVGNAQNSFAVPVELGGVAYSQSANTGKFNTTSLAGTSYVFGAEGEDVRGTLQVAGVMAFNSDGSVTGTLNWNDLSLTSPQAPLLCTGTWTVDPTGRVTVTDLTDGATFTYSMHLYLSGTGKALVLSADSSDVFAGEAFQQQAAALTAASFSGNYGLNASLYQTADGGEPATAIAVGSITVAPGSTGDTVAGYADLGAGMPDFAISGTFTPVANGVLTGTLSGLGVTAASASNPFTLYLVDSTQGVAIETGNAGLTLARVATQ
jgi:hypothetical protein